MVRDSEKWKFGRSKLTVLLTHFRRSLQLSLTILWEESYEAIVKGQNVPKPGVPEAFKVLVKELQSLGLDLKVLNINNEEIDLKQSFDEDEELVPQPAIEDHIDFGVDEGDLDEGFMAEDENGTSELEGSAASDESDLFLNDGE